MNRKHQNFHVSNIVLLLCITTTYLISGCTLPLCNEGEVVCADTENDQFVILQSDHCKGNKCTVQSNPQACQLYRCSNDQYLSINNGYCAQGSHLENGMLSCIPLCHDGEVICSIMDENDQMVIKQSSDDDEGFVNETPCQRYKCAQNEYVPITNGYCTLGSRIEDGALSCIPQCDEGQIVCAITDEHDQLQIKQKDSDTDGSVNETPCQRYKCAQNEYVAITNSYCATGSRIEDGTLNCIPRCENLPESRCKADQNQTIVQTCQNEGSDTWKTSVCAYSCKNDTESDYDDE